MDFVCMYICIHLLSLKTVKIYNLMRYHNWKNKILVHPNRKISRSQIAGTKLTKICWIFIAVRDSLKILPNKGNVIISVLIIVHNISINNTTTNNNDINNNNNNNNDCNWTQTQNDLVLKRTLNHLAKLPSSALLIFFSSSSFWSYF